MSTNPAIPCCCISPKFVCCKTYAVALTCPVEQIGDDCDVISGVPPEVKCEYEYKIVSCVDSEEECVCEEISEQEVTGTGGFGSGGGGGGMGGSSGGFPPGHTISACISAVFHNIKCENNQPPNDREICKNDKNRPCCKKECGPCGPMAAGCADDCPPPNCEEQECCEPPPPTLCCCSTIEGGECSVKTCGPCPPDPIPPNCYQVPACDQCTDGPDDCTFYQSALCCPTEFCCCNPEATCDCCDGSIPACCECEEPGCVRFKCICPCGSGPPSGPPLCMGCGQPTANPAGCLALGLQTEMQHPGNKFEDNFGTFVENSIEKGLIKTKTDVKLNTLFLFGYGYKNL